MTIDRLGPVDPVSKFNKTSKAEKAAPKARTDAVNVSDEARNMSEIYKTAEEVKITPDVRMDRVEEVKLKLQNPNYIDDTVLESVAEGIMKSFGLS